jgi:hypothetical protein
MEDLQEYHATTWRFLVNITMRWQYDGIANLFREAGIPLYGVDLGTTKENHILLGAFVPARLDRNYGVNIHVPADAWTRALALIGREDMLREAAAREAESGPAMHQAFMARALANKERDRALYKAQGGLWGDLSRRAASTLQKLGARAQGVSAGMRDRASTLFRR